MPKKFRVLILGLLSVFFVLAGGFYWLQEKEASQTKDYDDLSSSGLRKGELVLQLAIFADIHSDWERLQKAVEKVNNSKSVDFVLVLGDLTKVGSIADLNRSKDILDDLNINYYVVPGNHDVWYSKRDGNPHDYNFVQVFEDQPACFSENGFNFVFLDNSDEQEEIGSNHWLEIQNCLNKKEPVLFFGHIPLHHPANERVMGQYSSEAGVQAEILRDKLCNQKAKLSVAAHLHSFAKYDYACDNGYKLPMIASPALTQERNFQSPRFLYLDVFEDNKTEEKEEQVQ